MRLILENSFKYSCQLCFYRRIHTRINDSVFDKPKKFRSKFDHSYIPEILREIESKWKLKVDNHWKSVIKNQKEDVNKTKYILSMFPYPSGQLHLGHARIYTTSDILFKTSVLCGQHSIHPMGFDSFGLPAENAARLNGVNPFAWTESNVVQMKEQLDNMGYHFHWRENTSDPSFYRWTQWLFIQLYNSGLAYQGVSKVNWDPIDCTVLADEQVDSEGKSWRSGALVEKRFHKQWLIKTNAFVDDLFKAENILDTGHWSMILATQRWWMKKPNGYLFYLKNENQNFQVFTAYPELFISPKAFIGISPNHYLASGKKINEVVGEISNPFIENKTLQIRVVDTNTATSTQASVFVPREAFEDVQIRDQIIQKAKEKGIGGYFTSETYRDWLISRQRFWGTPIPIVHCPECGPVPEKEENLPIRLPEVNYQDVSDFKSNEISSPLKMFAPKEWLNVPCPNCGNIHAQRETDTCDTFFDSSWYFLRYFSEPTHSQPFDSEKLLPVYCYVGGKEHASLHLFYARFITHFLKSKGLINFEEPFRTLLMQAIVKGKAYKLDGKYITAEEAKDNPNVTVAFEKMSKSKGTGVNPSDLVELYGNDALRWTMVSVGNPESERLWDTNEAEFGPTMIFFHRIILTIEEYLEAKDESAKLKILDEKEYKNQVEKLNDSIDQQCFNVLYSFNSSYQIRNGTATIHRLLNSLRSNIKSNVVLSQEFERGLASLLVMISPIIPSFASECWNTFTQIVDKNQNCSKLCGFDFSKPVYEQAWPRVLNPEYKYIIKFTIRDQKGKEQEAFRIKVLKKDFGSWSEREIRSLLNLSDQEIEWIDIVKHSSVVVRIKEKDKTKQFFEKSKYEITKKF